MTTAELIAGILTREGEGVPPYHTWHDHGGRTSWGIDERSHPEAWQPGPPTRAEAIAIYARAYVAPFDVLGPLDEAIHVALVDDAVLSGLRASTTTLQRLLGVTIDGVLGPETAAAIGRADPRVLLVHLVQARAHRLARLVEADPTQLRFLVGWIDRALAVLG